MIRTVSAHRRANAFAQALEDEVPGSPRDRTAEHCEDTADRAGHGPLLALADELAQLPKPTLDPEVRTVQRAQLVAAMEAMLAEGTPGGPRLPEQRTRQRGAHRLRKLRPRSRWSKGLAAGGLTVGVAAGAFSGVAAASSDALPGDSLYGLKRGMEDLKLGMADGDTDRGELYLDQASTRMQEARRLMERGRSGGLDHESVREVRKALSGMRHDVEEGHRLLRAAHQRDGSLGPLQKLEAFARSHRGSWGELRDRLPVQLTDVIHEVSSAFAAIDEEVRPLKSRLPLQGGDERGRRDTQQSRPSSPERASSRPAPASSSPAKGRTESGSSKPQPSMSQRQREEQGLIGGARDLIDPPLGGNRSHGPASGGGGQDGKSGQPEVTLPPLLPGILPELGLPRDDSPS
ncbi:DUF5667 domain-containing protein [Streptomyces sp. URMC 123]|uniref:DUF5667 domain-containing protein n=1 Tax=Streptomyces sp. URMC 123 TaxID=3423403 RepID=UPI003F1C665D